MLLSWFSFGDITFKSFLVCKVRVQFVIIDGIQDEIFCWIEWKRNLPTIVLFSFKSDQTFARLTIFKNKISVSVELFLFVLQKDHIQDSGNFASEIFEGFISLTDIREISEVYSKRFSGRIAIQSDKVCCDFWKMDIFGLILFIREVFVWSSKLFLKLVLLIVMWVMRVLVLWMVGFWVRGGVTRYSITDIVVSKLVKPSTVFVEFEDELGTFDGESRSIWQFAIDIESGRIGRVFVWHKIKYIQM